MHRSEGSAAVAAQVTPESASLDVRRRLVADLPDQLDRMQRTLEFARGALAGPDPEAALGYLAVLCDRLRQTLATHQ